MARRATAPSMKSHSLQSRTWQPKIELASAGTAGNSWEAANEVASRPCDCAAALERMLTPKAAAACCCGTGREIPMDGAALDEYPIAPPMKAGMAQEAVD